MKLPHDLDKVPDGQLSVSMVDDNFDAIQEELTSHDNRMSSHGRLIEDMGKTIAKLQSVIQKVVDAQADATHAAKQARGKK